MVCDTPLRSLVLEDRRAEADQDAQQQRDQHRRADHQHHENGAPRPEHLAEREIEDPQRRRQEARGAAGWRRAGGASVLQVMLGLIVRHLTRYWNTAWRLSSGDVTSSITPYSPLAASSVSRE